MVLDISVNKMYKVRYIGIFSDECTGGANIGIKNKARGNKKGPLLKV